MKAPAGAVLSPSQLESLAEIGEERKARVGDALFRVGDASYPFMAILEGEVAILDADGDEIIRTGAGEFVGEMGLLSGQVVFASAIVTTPLRYIAVERDAFRELLFQDAKFSDLVLSEFIARRERLQTRQDVGIEIVGPPSSEATMRLMDFALALEPGNDGRHIVHLEDEHEIVARAIVLASGADYRKLPLQNLAAWDSASSTPPGRRKPSSAAHRASESRAEGIPPARPPSGSPRAARVSRFSTAGPTSPRRCPTI
jgi:CRP-like cAMP-binding protein